MLKTSLQNNISHKWTVNEMSDTMNMKLTRFNAFIKRKTGYSPFQYLISLRVEVAKDYLTNSTLNITQIALECGFFSSQHFAKAKPEGSR
jgi:transcriptional regulator GlxA family with amidase domain